MMPGSGANARNQNDLKALDGADEVASRAGGARLFGCCLITGNFSFTVVLADPFPRHLNSVLLGLLGSREELSCEKQL
jgi:hypothetical protein